MNSEQGEYNQKFGCGKLVGIAELYDDGSSSNEDNDCQVSSESDLEIEMIVKPTKLNKIIKST